MGLICIEIEISIEKTKSKVTNDLTSFAPHEQKKTFVFIPRNSPDQANKL